MNFTTVAQEAQSWPGTPLLFCTPDATMAAQITAAVEVPLPVYTTVAEALSALTDHDRTVSEFLIPVKGAARQARDVTTEACVRWDLQHLIAPATLVASELVTNAVRHARTVMTLQLRRQPRYLYLAVFDDDATEPVLRSDRPADTPGGRGLHLVELASARWGHQRQQHGKVVWACFDTSPDARTDVGTPG